MMKGQIVGLMKQAQQIQENTKKTQERLILIGVEGMSGAGLVKVAMTYKDDVRCVSINPSPLIEGEDKDLSEGLIAAAFNDVVRKAKTATQEKTGSPASGLGGMAGMLPPGFKLSS